MYCPNCGKQNPHDASFCSSCGKAVAGPVQRPQAPYVPNYLAQAILVTLFCCLPFGVVAIVYAAQVNGKLSAGAIQEATEASKNARTWCWVSFWVGLGIGIIYFFIAIVGGLASV